eukprot:SAG22_NODE_7771_length_709_cov_2.732787_1_plen_114_part_00
MPFREKMHGDQYFWPTFTWLATVRRVRNTAVEYGCTDPYLYYNTKFIIVGFDTPAPLDYRDYKYEPTPQIKDVRVINILWVESDPDHLAPAQVLAPDPERVGLAVGDALTPRL